MSTNTKTAPKQLLGVGVIYYVDRVPGYAYTGAQVQEMIDNQAAILSTVGAHQDMFELSPDDPNILASLEKKLASQEWDGILIGWGVRGEKNLTDIFEKAVNLCIAGTHGKARFMFPVNPDAVVDSVLRVFPELKKD